MNGIWEPAPAAAGAIVAYFCFQSVTAVFGTGRKNKFKIVGYQDYVMRNPYTAAMLERRRDRGESIPEWFKAAQS